MNRLRVTSSFVARFSLVCVVAIGVAFNIGAGGGADGGGSNGGGGCFVVGGAARAEEPTNKTRVDGNRLNYLDAPLDPYYPHRTFPKLTTPQWVGKPGVECVVTLGIDDMRDPVKYETFFRPILERLKKIDGRAPVSVMTCNVKPDDPIVAKWLSEGLSIECHTVDHPCPCLQGGDFAKAASTYHRCVDLMHEIPGNRPVAFRMPCCDSLNTPSPRFWAEIFNKTTEKGRFLQIDTSVFNIITTADETLPRELRYNEEGQSRFKRYIPFPSFVNTIEDYPYPYIIGGACWEFPCVVPSDWSAQHVQKPNNPDTVRDLKLALDATVLKQGTFNLVFHPHGWIRAEQIIELIDHAQAKHGDKVLFLTFAECLERLNKHLLGGRPLRNADGSSSGAMLADLNDDGYLDVIQLGPAATAAGGRAAVGATPADNSNTDNSNSGATSAAAKTATLTPGSSPTATKPLGRLARIWSPTDKSWSSFSSTVMSPH
ncbi:MAG TPA: polysaccharide deacetylase family protein, partial [Pirellulaceae bacterium]|nr:polysaccharide deacetylase family protein [Pirellulaceae bacterium]